jgi:hypothetical protein
VLLNEVTSCMEIAKRNPEPFGRTGYEKKRAKTSVAASFPPAGAPSRDTLAQSPGPPVPVSARTWAQEQIFQCATSREFTGTFTLCTLMSLLTGGTRIGTELARLILIPISGMLMRAIVTTSRDQTNRSRVMPTCLQSGRLARYLHVPLAKSHFRVAQPWCVSDHESPCILSGCHRSRRRWRSSVCATKPADIVA